MRPGAEFAIKSTGNGRCPPQPFELRGPFFSPNIVPLVEEDSDATVQRKALKKVEMK